jgi:IS30 family transposase
LATWAEENTNRLLRQYWPKCTDFKTVSPKEVVSVITSLNTRPGKKLNHKTPVKKMAEHVAALAA